MQGGGMMGGGPQVTGNDMPQVAQGGGGMGRPQFPGAMQGGIMGGMAPGMTPPWMRRQYQGL
jgi:hypothetical protein